MSAEWYEVVFLAARYLFAFLGCLIVLRAFIWLWSDHVERHRRLRNLPDAGTIGEFVVLEGSRDLSEGTSLPVPWEGSMGSVRSCDIVVPCEGIRPRHLFFSYEEGVGLIIHLRRGCVAEADGVALDHGSDGRKKPLRHGSFLRIGSALLRLRVFAGLDANAGFPEAEFPSNGEGIRSDHSAPDDAFPQVFSSVPPEFSHACQNPSPLSPGAVNSVPSVYAPSFEPAVSKAMPPSPASSISVPKTDGSNPSPLFPDASQTASEELASPLASSGRKRRRERWEADWSE